MTDHEERDMKSAPSFLTSTPTPMSSLLQLLREYNAVVFRDEALADIRKTLNGTFGSGTNSLLFLIGRACGIWSYKRLSLTYQNREELFDACTGLKEQDGWGIFRCEINGDGTGTVRVANCFEARTNGPSNEPTCHFMRGFITGFLSSALKRPVRVAETSCLARGDGECTFEIQAV